MFADRHAAGLLLLEKLSRYRGSDTVILGLARGGVVVASAIASGLEVSPEVLVVKKIPAPGESELALGALAPDGVSYVDWKFAQRLGVDEEYIKSQIRQLADQIKQKTLIYRKRKNPINVRDKTVVIVDDGVATGATLEAAIKWTRKKHARSVIAAIPVMPADTLGKIKPEVDELIVLETPGEFAAVGQFYKDFPQIEDSEVVQLLAP